MNFSTFTSWGWFLNVRVSIPTSVNATEKSESSGAGRVIGFVAGGAPDTTGAVAVFVVFAEVFDTLASAGVSPELVIATLTGISVLSWLVFELAFSAVSEEHETRPRPKIKTKTTDPNLIINSSKSIPKPGTQFEPYPLNHY
jgi:hypothetical protein